MYHLKIPLIFSSFFFFSYSCFGQSFTKTLESVGSLKRREITYNEKFDVVKEDYYSANKQQIITTIEYNNNEIQTITGYDKYPVILYKIDFIKGTYYDFNDDIRLNFKFNFIFHGRQQAKDILVFYEENLKNGKLIQADSFIVGNKTIVYDALDTRYLKYDIIKFDKSIGLEPIYKVFKGLILNFQNGKLNGEQKSFYGGGAPKMKSNFLENKILCYNSYTPENTLISKLVTSNGLSTSPQLLNGTILKRDNRYVFLYPKLIQAGDIFFNEDDLQSDTDGEYSMTQKFISGGFDVRRFMKIKQYSRDEPYTLKYKTKFDDEKIMISNPYIIKYLLNIPDFQIKKFQFSSEEDKAIVAIPIDNSVSDTTNIFQSQNISLTDSFYFSYSNVNLFQAKKRIWGTDLNNYMYLTDDIESINNTNKNEAEVLVLNNEKIGQTLMETFGIENILYLSPKVGSDFDEIREALPTFSFSKDSIQKFLLVFVQKMIKNIDLIKGKDLTLEVYSNLENPFTGISAGYYFDTDFTSHYRYFDFNCFSGSVLIRNLDGVRSFMLYNKNEVDYSDGQCTYTFFFTSERQSSFKVKRVIKTCD